MRAEFNLNREQSNSLYVSDVKNPNVHFHFHSQIELYLIVKGEVEICGKRAPVVGLVCMDQMMVDVTDIPEAQEGDEVILLGGGIGVDEYADWANLNRHDSLARTGKRVPRVYMENGKIVDIVEGLY